MHVMRRTALAVVVVVGAALGGFAAPALADFAVVNATMKGANEVPPADPLATGSAWMTLDSNSGKVCYWVITSGLAEPVTAAHLHQGAAGSNGPIVIPFNTPTHGFTIGCTTAGLPLIQSIIDNPSGFYTNVHNAQFPGGAIRGQLVSLATIRRPTLPAGIPGLPAGFPGLPAGFPGLPAGFPGLPAGFPGLPAGFPGLPAGFPGLPATIPTHPRAPRRSRHRHSITVKTPHIFVHIG
jgi:hypothetical protein